MTKTRVIIAEDHPISLQGIRATLATAPEKLNEDPHESAWMLKVKLSRPDEVSALMSAVDYETYVAAE